MSGARTFMSDDERDEYEQLLEYALFDDHGLEIKDYAAGLDVALTDAEQQGAQWVAYVRAEAQESGLKHIAKRWLNTKHYVQTPDGKGGMVKRSKLPAVRRISKTTGDEAYERALIEDLTPDEVASILEATRVQIRGLKITAAMYERLTELFLEAPDAGTVAEALDFVG